MKRKFTALLCSLVLLCVAFVSPFSALAADSSASGTFSVDAKCPTCGGALTYKWWSTLGAEVELKIINNAMVSIPSGSGSLGKLTERCESCGYEKTEWKCLGLQGGSSKPGEVQASKAPSGIGRKDLPGYADDNGTPTYNSNGELQITVYPRIGIDSSSNMQDYPGNFRKNLNYSIWILDGLNVTARSTSADRGTSCWIYFDYRFTAPVSGTYYIASQQIFLKHYLSSRSSGFLSASRNAGSFSQHLATGISSSAYNNSICFYCDPIGDDYSTVTSYFCPIILTVSPDTVTVNKQTNITINNNTWNGNIYVDSSNNLTYIYPEYTTINESNETVTNISNNPIIYNNETQQYYTYDSTTNNYYYITYETTPTPTPTPTPSPGTDPTPTPTPGGGSGGGDGGNGGSGSGNSGSSWWEKLLDKLGSAIVDGLLGAISAVLKLIFKLFSTILGWIIWLTSQVLTLFPFLPPGLGALLIGGVVVCFVIGIIKFIRG